MPEDLNREIAETLESKRAVRRAAQAEADAASPDQTLEIAEAILIAVVAVATAWGGYQAARWDGLQSERYGESSTVQIEADEAITLGGQQRLLDVTTFNTWIEARNEGRDELAALYERRFSPAYKAAFEEWIALDPFTDPDAPPGPSFMPGYRNPLLEQGEAMREEADRLFREGTEARQQADEYIRTTVVLATVLFLLALSQRFRIPRVRLGVVGLATVLMLYGLITLATFPRL